MAKMTSTKRDRAREIMINTSTGSVPTGKIGFVPPDMEMRIVEYKEYKFHVRVGKGMVINPKRVFKKHWKEFRKQEIAKGNFVPERPPFN